MAGSSWAVQGFWGTDGTPRDYGTAKNQWKAQGYDLLPDGTKVKLGAPAAPAQSQTLGGLGGTLATVGMGGSGIGNDQIRSGNERGQAGGGSMGSGNATLDQLTNIADPWSSQRGQYQTQLSSLMKDPSSFMQNPMFKASTDAGIEAVNRSAAAKGMLNSGNRLQALMDYGQRNASDNFYRMSDLLGGFAGARNQNPGGGLSAYANLQNANTSAYNADTSRRAQESSASLGQFNADTARQGNAQQAQYAQTQQDTAQQRWQQQQQQQQMTDLQQQMRDQLTLANNYR